MIFTLQELIDVIVMTVFVGYIFKDSFPKAKIEYDPLLEYSSSHYKDLWRAALITAPGIILHELAHKLVALFFGLSATFHAAYGWLGIGLLLRLLNTGFVFFVPGYVSIAGGASVFDHVLIAFAGPFLNLVLWGCCAVLLRFNLLNQHTTTLLMVRHINLFLFIFNILPIPGFDGYTVWSGLFSMIF